MSLFFLSCGKKDEIKQLEKQTEINKSSELQKKGKDFFYLNSQINNLKCADCHSDGTNDDNSITKFFPDIKGANKRTSTYSGKYKGEDVNKYGAGATFCYERFMMSKTPLSFDDVESLNAYYGLIAKSNEPAEFKYENIAIPEPNKNKLKEEQAKVMTLTGDSKKGEELFNKSCTLCHGDNSKIKFVPKLFKEFDGDAKSVTYYVRFGKKFMPFFSYEKISSQDIADLTAFIISKVNK
jgi:mono/diheme cytochrome c family protein